MCIYYEHFLFICIFFIIILVDMFNTDCITQIHEYIDKIHTFTDSSMLKKESSLLILIIKATWHINIECMFIWNLQQPNTSHSMRHLKSKVSVCSKYILVTRTGLLLQLWQNIDLMQLYSVFIAVLLTI